MSDQIHVICPDCHNEIDPEICWCGDYIKNHSYCDNHSPVPMGCDCARVKDDVADAPPFDRTEKTR